MSTAACPHRCALCSNDVLTVTLRAVLYRVADGTLSMEEARQRHRQLLQRQHFGREPPRYDPSKF